MCYVGVFRNIVRVHALMTIPSSLLHVQSARQVVQMTAMVMEVVEVRVRCAMDGQMSKYLTNICSGFK